MNRSEFLKNACAYGLCGCFGASLFKGGIAYSATNSEDEKSDWHIDFMQDRFKNLLDILNDSLDEETLALILSQLGGKCGDYFAEKYKDNPDGFYDFIKSNWAESVEIDNEKEVIQVNEIVRNDCN